MARPQPLTDGDLDAALVGLPGWTVVDGRLHRELRFADFPRAFGFMAAVATVAQAMDHHPDWENVWNKVTARLNTHDAGGITVLDFKLAGTMTTLAGL